MTTATFAMRRSELAALAGLEGTTCPLMVVLRDFPVDEYTRSQADNYAFKQREEYQGFNVVCSSIRRADGVLVYRVGIWV